MVRSIIVGNMSSLAWQEEGKDTAFIKIETSWRTMEIEKDTNAVLFVHLHFMFNPMYKKRIIQDKKLSQAGTGIGQLLQFFYPFQQLK